MDIRFLLAADSTNPVERRSRDRDGHMRSASEDTTHSSNTTLSNPTNGQPPPLRRDAVRVLQGTFDARSTASRSASPSVPGSTGSNHLSVQTPILETASLNLESGAPLTKDLRTMSKSSRRNSARLSKAPSPAPYHRNITTGVTAISTSADDSCYYSPDPTSFSYSPLSPGASQKAEMAFQRSREECTSDNEDDLDFLGTGTPIISPRLLAKVLQAKAHRETLMEHGSQAARKDGKEKRASKKENREKRAEKGKGGGSTKATAAGEKKIIGRDTSKAPSAASGAISEPKAGTSQKKGGVKRPREGETSGGIKFYVKAGPSSEASSTRTATDGQPPTKKLKGWKGYVEVEVSSDEDEDEEGPKEDEQASKAKSSDPDGTSNQSDDSDADSEVAQLAAHRGWKGWAVTSKPPDRTKLILLDAAPLVTTTRATRSGRTFGEGKFDKTMLAEAAAAAPRRSTSGISFRS